MGNTKRKADDRPSPWPFRPTLPPEPQTGAPSVQAAWQRDTADLMAMYRQLKRADNRSDLLRSLALDGYRARKENLTELQRLAAKGREWEQHFPDIGPGQLARVVDLLISKMGAQPAGETPAPVSMEVRRESIKALAAHLPSDDLLDGELG